MKVKDAKSKLNIINLTVYAVAAVVLIMYFLWLSERISIEYLQTAASNASVILFVCMLINMIPAIKKYFKPGRAGMSIVDSPAPGRRELAELFVKCTLWAAMVVTVMITAIARRRPDMTLVEAVTQDFSYYLDTNSYIEIAKTWYNHVNKDSQYLIVFFPLYGLLLRLFNFMGSHTLTGIMVSSVCSVCSGIVMYCLAGLDMERDTARRAVKYMYIFPSAFFIMLPMTEGVFLLLSLMYVYFVRRRKWLYVLLTGIAAGLVRSHGLLLLIIGGMEWFREILDGESSIPYILRAGIALLGPAMGFGAYLFLNYSLYNNPFHFLSVQSEHWRNGIGFFWNTPDYLVYYAYDWYKNWREAFYSTSVPQLVILYLTLTLFIIGAKRIRLSYTIFCIAYFMISYGQTWLISGPRYISCLFPLCLTAAYITQKKGIDRLLSLLYISMFAAYFTMFLLKWPVF